MDTYKINIEETWLDYPSPDGNAVAVYMTGCNHHCEGCHSPILQKVCKYSQPYQEIVSDIAIYAERANTNKIVLLGGDPLYTSNLTLTRLILKRLGKTHDICVFTGYSIENVKALDLKGAKFYKCGTFIKALQQESGKTDKKYTLASKNQNFYNSEYLQLSTDGVLLFNN